ncbi:PqqD family peptide modification chaperone [Microcoleus sp. FACHB-672]|uniref:PqqD family peptide modification chaperone n=1 Tax=Microcoleus sp. FACHB-672 TaxID=2692825 RepID=UPI001685996C|nr:PqqD family peptide modification chaperone [Microcoleus sp. FACHB-672]MBD2041465.1 PqqD family protein [Microcoleus sp. FACHB-672]
MTHTQLLDVTEDGFAFDPRTGESYTLNPCEWLVLQRLQLGENQNQVADFLSEKFGIPQSAAQRDVADFFGQLNLFGLEGGK